MRKKYAMVMKLFTPLIAGLLFAASAGADPLDKWYWRNPLPQGTRLSSITYAKDTFVTVGVDGTILTSGDGNNWTSRSCGTTNDNELYGIAYGNGTFVAVGNGGTVLTSSDGIKWIERTSGTTGTLTAVIYGNNMFVAVGDEGIILTSSDGMTWTGQSSGTTNSLNGIAYGNNMFVAAGVGVSRDENGHYYDYGTLLTSSDGITWTKLPHLEIEENFLYVKYIHNKFILNGGWHKTYTSDDGLTWTIDESVDDIARLEGVAYGNDKYIGVNDTSIFSSANGIEWPHHYEGDETEKGISLNSIAYGNNRFVAIGDRGAIIISSDGISWTKLHCGDFNDAWLNSVIYAADMFIAVGEDTIVTSEDGMIWAERYADYSFKTLNGITYGNNTFLAVGYDTLSEDSVTLTSPDGKMWTEQAAVKGKKLLGVTYGNNIFVAVGREGALLTSQDGITWTSQTAVTTYDLNTVAYGNGIFVAVNESGTILTSPDGIAWTIQTMDIEFYLNSITYTNDMFIIASRSRLLKSFDGVIWTTVDTGLIDDNRSITYGNSRYIAVGEGGAIQASPDGITWDSLSGTTGYITDAAYVNGLFIAWVETGEMLVSSEGIIWSKWTPDTEKPFYKLAYGNHIFVAVADDSTILTSFDGKAWTSRPENAVFDVEYGSGKFVAVGYGGMIITSSDGATWTKRTSGVSEAEALTEIAYCNDTFIALGDKGIILTSADGINWAKRESNSSDIFEQAICGNNIFLIRGYSDILASTDGMTWTVQTDKNFRGIAFGSGTFWAVHHKEQKISTSVDAVTWTEHNLQIFDSLMNDIVYGNNSVVAVGQRGIILQAFTSDSYILTINPLGSGSGTIADDTGSINCSWNGTTIEGACSASFTSGIPVTLTATADAGTVLGLWSDDCQGTNQCKIYMTDNKTVETAISCPITLSTKGKTYGYKKTAGSVKIKAPKACTWTAFTDEDWITLKAHSGKSGKAVTFSISPNPSSKQRTGTITVSDQIFTISQAGTPCKYTVSPAIASGIFDAWGDIGTISVAATPYDCYWSATVDSKSADWLTITAGDSSVGGGMVDYKVLFNGQDRVRTGRILIGNDKTKKIFKLKQDYYREE